MFQKIKSKLNYAAVAVQNALASKRAEGYVDTGVKILIAVVIGTLLISLLSPLIGGTIFPSVNSKIQSIIHYKG
ncbi:MAG: hypothetical protein J5585_07655 [Clostridia bacterium]|nr:hypothetical protein [Clostridia bacterium]